MQLLDEQYTLQSLEMENYARVGVQLESLNSLRSPITLLFLSPLSTSPIQKVSEQRNSTISPVLHSWQLLQLPALLPTATQVPASLLRFDHPRA